MQFDLFC